MQTSKVSPDGNRPDMYMYMYIIIPGFFFPHALYDGCQYLIGLQGQVAGILKYMFIIQSLI